MKKIQVMLATAALAMGISGAHAAWPDKPIEAIVPWPAGQELDILTRAIVPTMSKELGVPMAVINRPGGAGVIGTTQAVGAKGDGYTLLFTSVGPMLTQAMAGNAPYKATDMDPIGLFTASSFVLIARADAPFKTVQELEAYAKKAEKPLVLGHFGPAAVPTQAVYRMGEEKGWKFRGVTFSPATAAQLMSGDADIVTAPYNTVASAIKAGEVRALVTFNIERLDVLPDVPTLRESGHNFDVLIWQGLFVPKGTPEDVKHKVTAALQAALKTTSYKELAKRINSPVFFVDAKATAERISKDDKELRPVMQQLGLIKAE